MASQNGAHPCHASELKSGYLMASGSCGHLPCCPHRLKETQSCELCDPGREAMLACFKIKVPRPIKAGFLRRVSAVRKVIHCCVALPSHFFLDDPWDLFGNQKD